MNLNKFTFLARAVIVLMASITVLWGQQSQKNSAALPEKVASVLSHPLRQAKVANCADTAQALPWRNETTISYSSIGLKLTGMDALGRSWTTVVPASNIMTCEIWSAKLGNQTRDDLEIINYSSDAGGYNTELTILFFDSEGRPVPWQARGHFESSEKGIVQIALDQRGDAMIVVPTRTGDRWGGYAYINDLYKITDSGVTKETDNAQGSWPVITGNVRVLSKRELTDMRAVNLKLSAESSVQSGPRIVKITRARLPSKTPTEQPSTSAPTNMLNARVSIPDVEAESQETKLILSDGTSMLLPRILVVDNANGNRDIFFDQNVPDGVEQLKGSPCTVRATGVGCEEEDCHPFILWGTKT